MSKKIFTLSLFVVIALHGFAQLWTARNAGLGISTTQVSFTIGSISYACLPDVIVNDTLIGVQYNFYAYNPDSNTWTAKADFPGTARGGAVGFAIGAYGYCGLGEQSGGIFDSDFYQYDPSSDTWTAVAVCPESVAYAGAFSVGDSGYVVSGVGYGNTLSTSCFRYDPSSNSWATKQSIPAIWEAPFCCSTTTHGYCGFGQPRNNDIAAQTLYQYDPVGDYWTLMADIPAAFGNSTARPQGFVLDTLVYVANESAQSMYILNPSTDSWSTATIYPIPGGQSSGAQDFFAFTNGSNGYLFGASEDYSNYFWEYTPGFNFTLLSVSPDTFCVGDPITFTFTSNINFAADNQFFLMCGGTNQGFGLGIMPSDSVSGTENGTYTVHVPTDGLAGLGTLSETVSVSVAATSPAGQSAYSQSIFVKETPTVELAGATNYYCGGATVTISFFSPDGNDDKYYWSIASGVFDSTKNIRVMPVTSTEYYLKAVTVSTGCTLNDSIRVNIGGAPNPNLPDTAYAVCRSSSLSIGGAAVTGYNYSWSDSNGFTSTSASPTVSDSVNDIYYLTVTSDTTNCSATYKVTVAAKQPPAQTICLVTVDSASDANILVWEKLDRDATDSFFIYREIGTNDYEKIGAVPADSLSEFVDSGANPGATEYWYKISAMDTCGNESDLSPFHETLHIAYQTGGQLNWNTYVIQDDSTTPVFSFDVLRDSLGDGNWSIMLTVPGTATSASDVNYASFPNAQYRISANWSYTCTPTRGFTTVLSNIVKSNAASITNIAQSTFTVYPNPASSILNIEYTGLQPEWLTMYDVDGQIINEQKFTSPKIDISRLVPGIYFLEMRNTMNVLRTRFVKL